MKTYTKLFRIKYNNKIFDIFSDENHRKTFLEIRLENGIEKTYYPELKDYIHLELIYNKNSDILYSRKYTFKEKIVVFSAIGIATISSFQLLTNKILDNYTLCKESQNYQVVTSLNEDYEINVSEDNKEIEVNENTNPIVYEYEFAEITFDDVRSALKNNVDISKKYREYIELLIERLEERMPEIDLRTFYYNLKSLSFNIIPNDKWLEGRDGSYNPNTNTITLKESYDQGYEVIVVFHELCHTLKNIVLKDNDIIVLLKTFNILYYGKSFSEGFNTILTNYLLVDDWQNYFDADNRIYVEYTEMASTQYQILKLLNGKYDLYDYLNGDMYDLEPKLEELGIADITNIMDAYANTVAGITIIDNQEYDNLKQKILELRIKDELSNGKSDIELYNFVYQVQLYEATIESLTSHIKSDDIYSRTKELFGENMHICTKILSSRNDSDWNIRINNNALTNTVDNKVNIYKDNNVLSTKGPYNSEDLIIYQKYNGDEPCYRIGIKKFEGKQYNIGGEDKAIVQYESNIYDILTGEKVKDYEIYDDMVSILSNYTGLSLQFYDIDINTDMLEKKEFIEYVNAYSDDIVENKEKSL